MGYVSTFRNWLVFYKWQFFFLISVALQSSLWAVAFMASEGLTRFIIYLSTPSSLFYSIPINYRTPYWEKIFNISSISLIHIRLVGCIPFSQQVQIYLNWYDEYQSIKTLKINDRILCMWELQVRRYVYNDVIRLGDLEKLIDCSYIQVPDNPWMQFISWSYIHIYWIIDYVFVLLLLNFDLIFFYDSRILSMVRKLYSSIRDRSLGWWKDLPTSASTAIESFRSRSISALFSARFAVASRLIKTLIYIDR